MLIGIAPHLNAQNSLPIDSPGAFNRSEYKVKLRADPVKAIKYYCFDQEEKALFSNENFFQHLGWVMISSDDINHLAMDPGFRSDMHKNVEYIFDFIHNYDLGKLAGEKAKGCMHSVDSLAHSILQDDYPKTWAAYYAHIENKEKIAKQLAIEKAKAESYAKSPEGILENLYFDYAFVKKCGELRQGYAIVYANESELFKAKTNVKKEEDVLLSKHPSLISKKNELWIKAAKKVEESDYVKLVSLGRFDNDFKFFCQAASQRLNKSSQLKKDF